MSASSSSSLLAPSRWRYDVFPSFSGQDVRRNFLSHLLGEFNRKGINTFIDNQIRRSESIGPELVQAIRASRIGIVILTKNYASSSWCLDELLEIMESRKTAGQKVMTIFYDMNPSDVRKQTGDFGKAFQRTCEGKTEVQKQSWREALTNVANVLGEHSHNWDSEAAMILKIATDITKMLNFTPSRDFDHVVGIEAHIAKMYSLLCMESNEVRVVGIWGPAGIGKTTIARALYNRVSSNFELSFFMENVRGSYNKNDSYSSKLRLQEQFLSEMLNLKAMRIDHLGVAQERLNSRKVFIVLDDVDKLEQLEALANEPQWFGAGSRIIVTTEYRDLFKGHGINHIYEVNFPSASEALRIFSQSAFKQDSPPEEFMGLAVEVIKVTNNLPLGLCVLGSSLRGKSNIEWAHELPSLKASLHGDIEKILRVGYDSLGDDDKYKTIFLHIACLFDGENEDRVIQLLDNSMCDIKYGLGVLVERALVGQLQLLNFTGCINVMTFPAEIFQSFCLPDGLNLTLHNIGKYSLLSLTPEETHDFPLSLSLFGNDFQSIPHYVVRQVHFLDLSNCTHLRWLPELPGSLSELHADNCASLQSLSQSSQSSHDPKLILKFANCSELDQEARKLIIEQWACGYAVLPGSKVPTYFTHRARVSSLTINLDRRNLYGSLRFKACVVLPPRDDLDDVPFRRFQISCYVSGRHSITVYKWPEIDVHCKFQENHLFILNSYFTLEEDNIPEREMLFDFKFLGIKKYPETVSSNVLGCGVQLLEHCSCEYDSSVHPDLSTLPLEDIEGNVNNIAETRRSNKRERSSVAEGERTSKNLRISN